MNKLYRFKAGFFKSLSLISIVLFTSTNSLADVNQNEKMYTQEGYPFEGLVNRSEEVAIFYTKQAETISCYVEVSQNGQIWKGEEKSTNLKTFTQKPLRSCMERDAAKKLLANTF